MKKKAPEVYVVFDYAEDWEQALRLRVGDRFPPGGVLDWRGTQDRAASFSTRAEAQAAINRTEHYRLAFGEVGMPTKAACKIVPIRLPEPAP